MDELVIDDKKYVSTKRAAKMTGYAKDYVGQLCREGRVPARLVGRSWYVLDSAIQDHRFGAPKAADEDNLPERTLERASVLPPTWQAPKYQADTAPELPSINRIREAAKPTTTEEVAEAPSARSVPATEDLHKAWQEWFNVREEGVMHAASDAPEAEESLRESSEDETSEEGDVAVPIHAVYEEPLATPITTEIPPAPRQDTFQKPAEPALRASRTKKAPQSMIVRLSLAAGMLCALALLVFAVAGSGYADQYLASVGQAQLLAGVAVYNK